MNELEIIKYLLSEIEEEQKYNSEYEKAEKTAREKSKIESGNTYTYWWSFMPSKFKHHVPRKSVIKANSMKIRQLLLKLY